MRVKSALWVGSIVRRYNSAGAIVTVMRKGAEEAGAIFIVLDRLDGAVDLFGPAPQASFDEARPEDRRFQKIAASAPPAEISDRIGREVRFDPDLWVVEIEDRAGRVFFETVEGGP